MDKSLKQIYAEDVHKLVMQINDDMFVELEPPVSDLVREAWNLSALTLREIEQEANKE